MGHKQVAVGLSGGVDSAVAALLLLEQGFEVIGVTMQLWQEPPLGPGDTAPDPVTAAQNVADNLGISLHVVDSSTLFRQTVVEQFIAEYRRGRTPNPCLVCNKFVKFGFLRQQAMSLGANYFATGHYARVQYTTKDNTWRLHKGHDLTKDQSYALYMLGQKELSTLLLPLGELTKAQVRQLAQKAELGIKESEESQDLCFVFDNDYRRFLRRYAPDAFTPGPILDSSGQVIGEHKGLAAYTIGQRGGLGIAAPDPLYVRRIDVAHNALVVGTRQELGRDSLIACKVNWIQGIPPHAPLTLSCKIRYRARPVLATVTALPEQRVQVHFSSTLRDITPGQSVVFYDQDVVIGGGVIQD